MIYTRHKDLMELFCLNYRLYYLYYYLPLCSDIYWVGYERYRGLYGMFEVHGSLAGRGGFCIFHVEDLETSTWRKLDAQMRDFKVWTSTVVWTSRVRSLRSQLADASVRELPFCPRIATRQKYCGSKSIADPAFSLTSPA